MMTAMSRSKLGKRLAITILILAPVGGGCGESGQTTRYGLHSESWDSAGVTMVENERPPADSRLPWTIGAQPSLSIGSVDGGGADQLFQVADATRLADGRIVIANVGSNELRVFNADGSHSATWGGRGEGPGEFTSYSPTAVAAWPGDSVAAPNPWGAGLTLFDTDGNHGRDVRIESAIRNVVDLLPDGKVLAYGPSRLREDIRGSSGLVRTMSQWAILGSDGGLHASLGDYPGAEFHAMFDSDGNIAGGRPHPFGRGTLGAVWGDLTAIGVQDSYEIKAFAADGSLVRIVRRDGDPGQPTQADQDAYWERMYADMTDDQRTRSLSLVEDMPLVDSYPAFEEILGDGAGYLWVREYGMSGEGAAVWTVFDREGRVQGLVETPGGLEVFEIGEDYILGRKDDELGVEYVEMWALDRGASPAR